jgi:hypothetical protein
MTELEATENPILCPKKETKGIECTHFSLRKK